jgi:GxxExxY protein
MRKEGGCMLENEVAEIILDAAFDIHRKLGPGLFESVYETVLAHELTNEYGSSQTSSYIFKTNRFEIRFIN